MKNVALLVAGVFVAVVVVFAIYLTLEGDARKASEQTSQRAVGVASGAGGSVVAALVVGIEAVLQAPELLITLLGIGAIISGISWQVFGATAFVTYILGIAVGGGQS